MSRLHRFLLLILWTMMTLGGIAQAQEFYEARLRAGKEAYRQKRYPEAVEQFRVAAFGFLETPPLLSETLARLALAESSAGRSADAAATLSRFVDVERRFGSYARAALEPETRAEFQELLIHKVAPATLQSVAGLAPLVETDAQKAARLPPRERRKALEAGMRREPDNAAWPLGLAQDAAERRDDDEVLRWTARALRIAPDDPEALALQVEVRTRRRQYSEALADLRRLSPSEIEKRPQLSADRFVCLAETGDWPGAETALRAVPEDSMARPDVSRSRQKLSARLGARGGSTGAPPRSQTSGSVPHSRATPAPPGAGELTGRPQTSRAAAALAESRRLMEGLKAADAAKILLEALRSEPDNRELRVALLEASCLSGDWSRGVEQVAFVAPFSEREALPMFYAAVVLYQTGKIQEAREYMERVRPRVSGKLVDEYARKILGAS
jgi:tetratricopeptide (TPR) repeat protein